MVVKFSRFETSFLWDRCLFLFWWREAGILTSHNPFIAIALTGTFEGSLMVNDNGGNSPQVVGRLAPVNDKSGHRTIRKGGWDPFPHSIDEAMGEKFSSANLWSKRVASQRLTLVGAKEAVVNGPSLPMKPRNPRH